MLLNGETAARILGRTYTPFNPLPLQRHFAHRRVMVTGAGGSIGREVCLALSQLGCSKLILLDNNDHSLIESMAALAACAPQAPAVEILCDVREPGRLAHVFDRERPEIVIHAAALKHVHLGERHPAECVLTNLIGVRNVIEALANHGGGRFLLVSTDKAADPVSVMGAAKRLAEAYVSSVHASDNRVEAMAVRFGNVFGTRGSVAPIFAAQIAAGGPVRVTHKDMERYFMVIEDAVRLILTGAAKWESADPASPVFLLEMGQPIKILDLAHRMIEVAGKTGQVDVVITQMREGEKVTEALFDAQESVSPSGLEGIYRIRPAQPMRILSPATLNEIEQAARTKSDSYISQYLFSVMDEHVGRPISAAG
jgi:O-antigen biosynthesis protein WbqV